MTRLVIDGRDAESAGGNGDPRRLLVVHAPNKRAYRPGEEVSYEGARFATPDGEDVTNRVEYSVAEGSAFKARARRQEVVATFFDDDGGRYEASFFLERKANMLPIVLVVLLGLAVTACAGVAWWFSSQVPVGESGAYLIPKGDMTDEEAQDLLDEMAEKSRITVSLAPYMVLRDDGSLRVNLVVADPNNGLSERLEVEQDGRTVFRSGVVEPGYQLEWGASDGAQCGPAIATVYAVNGGADTGNPVSVEVQIVEPGFTVPEDDVPDES